MNSQIRSNEWEIQFNQEAIAVEELLIGGDIQLLSQSKIRIALENNILSWESYKSWLQQEFDIPVIKSDLSLVELKTLKDKVKENKNTFAHYKIWTDDLIPLATWDDQIIVCGLAPTDKLFSVPNSIFVLCSIDIMNEFASVFNQNMQNFDSSLSEKSNTHSTLTSSLLTGLELETPAPRDLNFSKIKVDTQTGFANLNEEELNHVTRSYSAWNQIEEKHLESSSFARRNFDAYVVLKIIENKTKLFKMDDDLKNENINETLLEYDLTTDNPFQHVYKTGTSESFGLNQLHLQILDFKYACVTPLKLGAKIIGFLVGFKVTKLNADDEKILELLALKNAA